jgi:uncharacterized protein (DUF58 family)
VSAGLEDRHLLGAGAAACIVCCAPPILALLGIAGAGAVASIATVVLAGAAFAAVVMAASLLALWARRRVPGPASRRTDDGPVELTITARPPDAPHQPGNGH